MIKQGDVIPGNMYFTTTRLHQELVGGVFKDVIIKEAHDPSNPHNFKGNIDLNNLENLVTQVGPSKIPFISLAGTVNMAGGQPVSMDNLKKLRHLCQKYGIPIYLDATRIGFRFRFFFRPLFFLEEVQLALQFFWRNEFLDDLAGRDLPIAH